MKLYLYLMFLILLMLLMLLLLRSFNFLEVNMDEVLSMLCE
jgi:hypothetical protein